MNFNQPIPELPVSNLEKAQAYYTSILSFQLEWEFPNEICGLSNGETALFLRQRKGSFEPCFLWVSVDNADASFDALSDAGAKITEDVKTKPWGLRQFTLEDLDGNVFYMHQDL